MNQFHSCTRRFLQLDFNIICVERQMMNAAGRIFFEKFCDRAIRISRLQKFDVNFANGEKCCANFLRWHLLATFAFQTERLFIIRHRFIERERARNSQMVDFLNHNFSRIGRNFRMLVMRCEQSRGGVGHCQFTTHQGLLQPRQLFLHPLAGVKAPA